jgi:hypothetical protein
MTIDPYTPDTPDEGPIELQAETIKRLDRLREDGQSYDTLITELLDIYETMEWSLARSGDLP